MPNLKRFFDAIRDYFQQGKAGDIALLKTELISLGANADLLAQLHDLNATIPLIKLDQLSQLPKGTLGYEYAQHLKQNGIQPLDISPDLLEIAKRKPFALRFTVTHDIIHVLLGFDTSYAGEIGVLSFTVAQNYSLFLRAFQPFAMLIYPFALPKQGKAIWANFHRGKALGEQARCLLTYRFEEDWGRAIAEIRSELRLIL